MSNPTGPCDWPIAYPTPADPEDPDAPDAPECDTCSALDNLSPEMKKRAEQMARDLLWNWTGRRFGACPVAVRPCRAECPERPSTFWGMGSNPRIPQVGGWTPALIGGQWYNLGCGVCPTNTCSCAPDRARSIELPGPVSAVSSVWIDGEELPESAYTLRDNVIYRVDGGVWPMCNDDVADPRALDSGAWEIVYLQGYAVPVGGQVAAYILACELAKAMCGDDECALPSRVQSVTRQGVSVAILDTFDNLDEGRTGIWEIDSWITSVTLRRTSPPQVFSPDILPGSQKGTFEGLGRGMTR